ncbi:MAG: hypothetical protein I3273_04165 [Candidatus Moeniiplasma glomeromycotorum]|nr:hypothetical protein [Candidatus Moeniiplasma glomeromycotorum]
MKQNRVINRPDNRTEVKILKKIDYFLDNNRYDGEYEYCGTCSFNIAIEYRHEGTEYEQYLGNGQGYRCEMCDGINYDDKSGPVFHRNCPCFCYFCPECDLNVLKDDESEVDCDYQAHDRQRNYLLKRLGINGEEA